MNFATAKLAGNFHPKVFLSNPQLLGTMRAVRIEGIGFEFGRVQTKTTFTEFALNTLAYIFAVDPQFPIACRAFNVVARRFDFDHRCDLLQRNEFGNHNTAFVQIRIQKCSARLTMDQVLRHEIAAMRALASGPSRHQFFPVLLVFLENHAIGWPRFD